MRTPSPERRRDRGRAARALGIVGLGLALAGCALFERSASCAARKLVAPELLGITSEADSPRFCAYHRTLAQLYAPYAIASLNAYLPERAPAGAELGSCRNDRDKVRCPRAWRPDPEAVKDLRGLYMEAFYNTEPRVASPSTVEYVIAFRGTEFDDLQDWRANLRWFLPLFRRTDQYPESRRAAVEWVARACRRAAADGKELRVVTTGHSLGGGLAQGAAYAILRALPPPLAPGQLHPRSAPASEEEQASRELLAAACAELQNPVRVVSVVFDPSPVTAYYDGQDLAECENPRSRACRLPIVVRVYESGEVLAYARRFLSWFYPVALNTCEDRFDFGMGLPIRQHQMRRIASGLIRIARDSGDPDLGPVFDHHCPTPTAAGPLLCETPVAVPCAEDRAR